MKKINFVPIELITSIIIVILFFLPWFGVDVFFSELSLSPAKIGPVLNDYIGEESIPFYLLYAMPILAVLSVFFHLQKNNKLGHQIFIASCIVNLILILILIVSAQYALNNIPYIDILSFVDLTQFTRFSFWATIVVSIIGLFFRNSTVENIKEKIQEIQQAPRQNKQTTVNQNPRLCCLEGEMAGAEIPLDERGMKIGREAKSCNFVIMNASNYISRQHLIVKYDLSKNQFIMKDVSSNGTFFLNGKRIPKDTDYSVAPNTHFYIGKREHVFTVRL
ncbi:MAG: FHA domain-containing protein [Clostridiales bacterium]|nr:FHA domain-containing protein [Clostridiales bacterium]